MAEPNAGQASAIPSAGVLPSAGAPGTPEVLPDIRKPDIQLLMQDLAQSRREVFESRRDGDRRVNEERDRSRWEMRRSEAEWSDRIRKAERENDALISALGRLRQENDILREENAVLKLVASNGHGDTKSASEPEVTKVQTAPQIPQTSPFKKIGGVPVVPPSEPAIGKFQAIDPTKLV